MFVSSYSLQPVNEKPFLNTKAKVLFQKNNEFSLPKDSKNNSAVFGFKQLNKGLKLFGLLFLFLNSACSIAKQDIFKPLNLQHNGTTMLGMAGKHLDFKGTNGDDVVTIDFGSRPDYEHHVLDLGAGSDVVKLIADGLIEKSG